MYYVEKSEKNDLLLRVLKKEEVTSALVFTRTKHEADRVVRFLTKGHVQAMAIHGNKSQNARQKALAAFKNHEIQVLVATDIAARGIDIEKLSHVINYNIPNISETYVHRIGRTARAGQEGIAISFCQNDERAYLKDIEKLIRYTIPVVKDPEAKTTVQPQAAESKTVGSPNQTPASPANKPAGHRPARRRRPAHAQKSREAAK